MRLASGAQDRYDLVVGADGLHSNTRRLAFGPEKQFLKHLDFYVALADLPSYVGTQSKNSMYNYPGQVIGFATFGEDNALATFCFRAPWIDYDYHDLDAQKQILIDAFAGHDEWKIPELLDAAAQDPELYFDSVSQVHMPTWHNNRIVLVGDAAYGASNLSGRGATLALTGAWALTKGL